MPSHQTIDLTSDGPASRILLNRPEPLNAWNEQFGLDLLDAGRKVADDDSIRALLVTGAGRGFSSGADLKEQRGSGEDGLPDLSARLREIYHPIITGLREMPKPVVAAVNGPAVGIGCSLALAADLIVAAESAYFLLAFVNIGLGLDGGASALLPAMVGHARAFEFAYKGERLPAAKACEWGLVNEVLPREELRDAAGALAARFAAGPPGSYASIKRMINASAYAEFEAHLDVEAVEQQRRAESADFVEGVLAFMQKRPAQFTRA